MSCPELVKLVKAYTYGEIPLEVYREKRRHLVDKFTNGDVAGKSAKKKIDPLDSYIASAPEKPKSLHKNLYFAIAAATLAVVLAIGISIFLFPDTESTIASSADLTTPKTASKSRAQRLSEAFLQSDQWNEESINQFILDWQILSNEERQQAQSTQWFDDFKNSIQTHLTKQKSAKTTDRPREDLMTNLLATIDPGYFIGSSFFDQSSTAQVESDHVETPASEPKQIPPVAELTKEPTQAPKTKISEPPKKEAVAAIQKPTPKKSKQAASSVEFSQADIVLNKFVKSFENGNLNGLMKLFSGNATTNHHTSAEEISASYAELFQTTTKRDLKFSDFTWKPAGNNLEGSGKYLAHLNPKDTNIEQIFSADVTVLVDAASQPAVITGLYLTNQQFSTSLSESVKAAIPEAQKLPPPNNDELRTLLQKFVSSYNTGDVQSLMSLFSQEARTNDRSNINEIREDYTQLFQTTKSREIVLSDVTWKFAQNKAVASGLFEAKIQPITNRQINVYRGKIRIAVTKYEGGILITQLLHNTQ